MTTVIKHLQQHKQVVCFGSEQNQTPCKRADCEFILFCFSIVAQRPCVRTSPSGGRQDKKQDLLSFIFPILFLKPFSSIPLSDCHFDLCLRLWMARHTMRQGRCTRGLCP